LRKKGNPNAMTLHKLLYDSFPRQGGGFYRKPKPSLIYTVIVVDEVSMVPKSMIDLLLSHKIYVIFLGDPGQLSPINKDENNKLLEQPNIFLETIMRQAAESDIIQLTMKIRNGEDIEYSKGKDALVIPKRELNTGHLLWADTIICATNKKRHEINNQMRELLGYSGALKAGEKIVVKRNYWEECNVDGEALVNGSIGIINKPYESFVRIPPYIKSEKRDLPFIECNFTPEGGKSFNNLRIDKNYLLKEEPCVDWRVSYQLGKLRNKIGDILPKQATYGYALTCHCAQGSQWDKVLVIEEDFPFDKKEHARWLYTACTRSSSKLVLVR
jgi:ATP-dependent exoDNAse (exonuclease V) alpha subunit